MKKTWLLAVGLTSVIVAGLGFTQHRLRASVPGAPMLDIPMLGPAEDAEIRTQYLGAVDQFDRAIIDLDSALIQLEKGQGTDPATPQIDDSAQAAFRRARYAYKTIEVFVERYAPFSALTMNGPAIDKPNEDMPTVVIPPNGFQVIEASLFPTLVREDITAMRQEAAVLRVGVRRLREIASYTKFTNEHLFDASRVQLARIVTLGLAGFDASLSLDGLGEAAASLRGMRTMLARFESQVRDKDSSAWITVQTEFEGAIHELDTATSFESFDRLHFIVVHTTPLVRSIDRVRTILDVPLLVERRTWKTDASTVFGENAFDLGTYAPPYAQTPSQQLVELGCSLFSEPQLSENGSRSCASCHVPSKAFTDGLPRAVLQNASGHGKTSVTSATSSPRNTPTLIGAAYQATLFADQRVAYLEDQITEVLDNPLEMGGGVDAAAKRIAQIAAYQASFVKVFGHQHGLNSPSQSKASNPSQSPQAGGPKSAPWRHQEIQDVNPLRLRIALAAYLRSLSSLNSRFDQAVRGDTNALTHEERRGFNVFMSKAKCGTCHFVPFFNGTVPPDFIETEIEVIGTPTQPVTRHATIDADVGAAKFTRAPLHKHAFKTPTLRNIALTAPYMHNGAYHTLESVIEFYELGGGLGIGANVPNQTLPPDRLSLTQPERTQLLAFLKALTDTTGTTRQCRPLR